VKTSDFYYELPENLIAQTPEVRRDASKLMLLDKATGEIGHRHFFELPRILRPGDCLVLNDSRVLPARLIGNTEVGAAVELLLLNDKGDGLWECLTRPGKKAHTGTTIIFGDGALTAKVEQTLPDGNRLVRMSCRGIFMEELERLGRMPLPPYIKKELKDAERYQTVYSKNIGSAAAPTAGLHFTKELIEELRSAGIEIRFITLHVGLGTFRPVREEDLENHSMHPEYCQISAETAKSLNTAKREGRRIVACGTTSCRTLEAVSDEYGYLREFAGWVNIFLYPGYTFKITDALITNFHLPESTLIMLVSALAGRENILRAYRTAVEKDYRFFSFGDAMLIQ